jgi:RNA polymerase sigma factor (TIGR02999 family)
MRGERPGHTLQSSALVHEAYLRLVEMNPPDWESRSHFFAIAAQLMRQILVDHARRYRARKRGGSCNMLSLDDSEIIGLGTVNEPDIIAIDDALQTLAKFDERKARVVEMRFFGGLNSEEIGQVLRVSAVTVSRDWSTARAWLHREMSRTA